MALLKVLQERNDLENQGEHMPVCYVTNFSILNRNSQMLSMFGI